MAYEGRFRPTFTVGPGNQEWRSSLRLLVVTLVLLAVAACQPRESKLVGKWKHGEETVTFSEDKRVSWTTKHAALTGRWTISRGGRVKLEMTHFGEIETMMTLTATIEGDKLHFEFPDGSTVTFQKGKD
jgi:hypothetical protein